MSLRKSRPQNQAQQQQQLLQIVTNWDAISEIPDDSLDWNRNDRHLLNSSMDQTPWQRFRGILVTAQSFSLQKQLCRNYTIWKIIIIIIKVAFIEI